MLIVNRLHIHSALKIESTLCYMDSNLKATDSWRDKLMNDTQITSGYYFLVKMNVMQHATTLIHQVNFCASKLISSLLDFLTTQCSTVVCLIKLCIFNHLLENFKCTCLSIELLITSLLKLFARAHLTRLANSVFCFGSVFGFLSVHNCIEK